MNKFESPIVLIIGAGATRGSFETLEIPPPVDRDFFDIAAQIKSRRTEQYSLKVLKMVSKFYRRINGISMESYYRDLDSRKRLNEFSYQGRRKKNWTPFIDDLNELIRRVYVQTTCEVDSNNRLKPLPARYHTSILSLLKPEDSIITFNYDLAIEDSFPRNCSTWNPRYGYGEMRASGYEKEWSKNWCRSRGLLVNGLNEKSISLLKMHGSVNWGRDKNKINLKDRPYNVEGKRPEGVFIVTPSWIKEVNDHPVLKSLWRSARRKLSLCNTLIIIGYSLPETDFFARSLLQEAVRDRTPDAGEKRILKQIHLVDPDESTKDKFVDLFNPIIDAHGVPTRLYRYKGIREFYQSVIGYPIPKELQSDHVYPKTRRRAFVWKKHTRYFPWYFERNTNWKFLKGAATFKIIDGSEHEVVANKSWHFPHGLTLHWKVRKALKIQELKHRRR